MSFLAHSSGFLSPQSNPIIRGLLKITFYNHFCAGETEPEVRKTTAALRSLGCSGVILIYAKEEIFEPGKICSPSRTTSSSEEKICQEAALWAKTVLTTISMTNTGDFVAVKFSGAGSHTWHALLENLPPTDALRDSVDLICKAARKQGVRILIDAEQTVAQKTVDRWSLEWMEKYNRRETGHALLYATYQSYLKATPSVLSQHLKAAREKCFILGVKLVRGAYLSSDARHLIHDTKADTDNAYDSIAASLVLQEYGSVLKAAGTTCFPHVNVVLATHNLESVKMVQALRNSRVQAGQRCAELVFAQLHGMADDVNCELILAGKNEIQTQARQTTKTYRYLVWGSVADCMKYLLRRAQENQDAVNRTKGVRTALWRELARRILGGNA